MPTVQIEDVPDEVHAVLRRRAAAAHQSLQEYLLRHLIEEASHPAVDDVLERAGQHVGGSVSLAESAALVRRARTVVLIAALVAMRERRIPPC